MSLCSHAPVFDCPELQHLVVWQQNDYDDDDDDDDKINKT